MGIEAPDHDISRWDDDGGAGIPIGEWIAQDRAKTIAERLGLEFETKKTGARETYASGSVRDTEEGKGAFGLLPLDALDYVEGTLSSEGKWMQGILATYPATSERILLRHALLDLRMAGMALWRGEEYRARLALSRAIIWGLWAIEARETAGTPDDPNLSVKWPLVLPFPGLLRVAQLYQRGAKNYLPRNWERGQPTIRVFSSGLRHGYQAQYGLRDEDHDAALVWNCLALLTYSIRGKLDGSMWNETMERIK